MEAEPKAKSGNEFCIQSKALDAKWTLMTRVGPRVQKAFSETNWTQKPLAPKYLSRVSGRRRGDRATPVAGRPGDRHDLAAADSPVPEERAAITEIDGMPTEKSPTKASPDLWKGQLPELANVQGKRQDSEVFLVVVRPPAFLSFS
jgi:hypothetical protein